MKPPSGADGSQAGETPLATGGPETTPPVEVGPHPNTLGALRQHRGLRTILANISWLWVDSAVAFAASFAGGIVVARALGPSGYGLLGYASGLMSIMLPIAGLGTGDLAVRDLIAGTVPAGRILGTTFALQTVGSLAAFALAAAASSLLGDAPPAHEVTVIVSLSILATPLNVPGYWFAARLCSRYTVWARDGALVVCTLLRVAMAVLGAPVVAFAWLAVAQALLGGAILLALSRGRAPGLRCWQVSRPDSIRLLREGWPLLAAALAAALGTRLDMVMLSKLAGPVPTGQYTAAVRLSELLQVVPTAIAVSVFPALIHARDTDLPGSRLGAFMQALYDLMAALGLAIAVPLSLLARPAATALYGSAYTASGPILAAHVWGFVFTCLGVARARWLLATRGTSLLLYTSLLGAGVNAGLNLLLIPRHGALGAAWAAVAAQAVATYVSCALWPALRAPFVQMSRALLLPLRLRSAWRGMVALWRDTAEPTIEPESSVV